MLKRRRWCTEAPTFSQKDERPAIAGRSLGSVVGYPTRWYEPFFAILKIPNAEAPPRSPGPWNFPWFLFRNATGKPSSEAFLLSLTLATSLRTAFRVVLPWPALHAFWIAVALTMTDVYVGRPNISGLPPCDFLNAAKPPEGVAAGK